MAVQGVDQEGFESVYRRHVDNVVAGNMRDVLADMAPGSVPSVFEGVRTPQGPVRSADVLAARVDGQRAVGEAVYRLEDEVVGLRSGWVYDGSRWVADQLENFDAEA
ncbi:hypothetical protein [Nocardioides daejeonensis]|uniref:hypothetical protein n=1 Tax=Nocardioides daejeonensis TaxID=1046556 RepID=UPI0019510B0E|nr:hypothetical protein [Nocardioides daejeonensis]